MRKFIDMCQRNLAWVLLIITCMIFGLTTPHFFSLGNIFNVLNQYAYLIIATCGVALVMIGGELDMSIGYHMGICNILCAMMLKNTALPVWLIVVITICISIAMSSLLAVTGDHPDYLPYLKENGAFLEESDAVFAAQIYCPIIDLAHADQAYEWMFGADKTCEDSHAGPAETMTPFKEALSKLLAGKYITYFNALALPSPVDGTRLSLNADGRSGSAYDYLMGKLEEAAAKYLTRLPGTEGFTAEQYLSGDYTFLAPVPEPPGNKDAHHAGPGMDTPEKPERPMSLGELMLRPPRGQELPPMEPKLALQQGTDKRSWLSWDGTHARIRDLDSYVLNHRGRMKPCTSFDVFPMTSGENQVFGTPEQDFVHYNTAVAEALEELKDRYPEEYALYYAAYAEAEKDTGLQERMRLMDPMPFVGTQAPCTQAKHYRIRVGGRDADTATTVSMALALKLQKFCCGSVDYAIVWERPHCDADYPGEVCDWIRKICG